MRGFAEGTCPPNDCVQAISSREPCLAIGLAVRDSASVLRPSSTAGIAPDHSSSKHRFGAPMPGAPIARFCLAAQDHRERQTT